VESDDAFRDLQYIQNAFQQGHSDDPLVRQILRSLSKIKFDPLIDLLKIFLNSQDIFWIEMGMKFLPYFKNSISQIGIDRVRSILDVGDTTNLKISAAGFLGFNDPEAKNLLVRYISDENDKFLNAAIASSALASNNIPPYIALGISNQITSDEIRNSKLDIEAAIQAALSSSKK
jgi:hypothetical protein